MERILWNFKFLTFHNSQNTISITCVHPNTLNHLGKDEKFKRFFCESKTIPNLNVLPPVASCTVGDTIKLYFFQCKSVYLEYPCTLWHNTKCHASFSEVLLMCNLQKSYLWELRLDWFEKLWLLCRFVPLITLKYKYCIPLNSCLMFI